jgi:hypothetical protein
MVQSKEVVIMAINTWKLWEKLGLKPKEIRADITTDLNAINNHLKDITRTTNQIRKYLVTLQKLRKEANMLTDNELRKQNLRKQIEEYDKLLLLYEYYQSDADINGIRVKRVAKYYFERSQKSKLHDVYDKIKKEERWTFDW